MTQPPNADDELRLLARKWVLPILIALADGTTRPVELRRTIQISDKSLFATLRHLQNHGLVTRHRIDSTPPVATYHLTDAGHNALRRAQLIARLNQGHDDTAAPASYGAGVSDSGRPADTPIDTSRAHPARMYDYWLGGKNNFAADREAADRVLTAVPQVATIARENRKFLGRAVRFLAAERGIRQFIDIGTGIPTQGNTHEIAHAVAPDARVLYVDNDPIVGTHTRALLTPGDRTAVLQADLRDPATILSAARDHLDLTQPTALMFIAVLHFIPDTDHPYELLTRYRDALPAGSHLAISHAEDNEQNRPVKAAYTNSSTPAVWRPRAAIERFFTGWDLLAPGVVRLHDWRPDGDEQPCDLGLCGVGSR